MSQTIQSPQDLGAHITDGPVTLANSAEAVPSLLRNSIDSRIVKVRPMSTPLDQISRCAGARSANSMIVEYYSVDTRPTETTLAAEYIGGKGTKKSGNVYVHNLKTADDLIFDPSETIYIPDAVCDGNKGVIFYVNERLQDGIEVTIVSNDPPKSNDYYTLGAINQGAKIIRMGRAAGELDVQTPQYQALPVKKSNNCQIFKMQVEEGTFHKIANKEVGWTFSDQEESAIIDMRLGMEKNFLFGVQSKIYDYRKQADIYLTGGLWSQIPNEYRLATDAFGESELIDICKTVFTGNTGSKRKILFAGSELLAALAKMSCSKIIMANETKVRWGVEFSEIRSNFGTLFVVHSEIFDQCGHAADGIILDPDYITKYVHVPFTATKLDLRKSGQRNADAVVLTEASCLVARYPSAHLRIVSA